MRLLLHVRNQARSPSCPAASASVDVLVVELLGALVRLLDVDS